MALRDPGAVSLRRIDRVLVEGKSQPVILHEVLDAESAVVRGKLTNRVPFEAGLACYEALEFEAAIGHFERVLSVQPSDTVALFLLAAGARRCSRRRASWCRPHREELNLRPARVLSTYSVPLGGERCCTWVVPRPRLRRCYYGHHGLGGEPACWPALDDLNERRASARVLGRWELLPFRLKLAFLPWAGSAPSPERERGPLEYVDDPGSRHACSFGKDEKSKP